MLEIVMCIRKKEKVRSKKIIGELRDRADEKKISFSSSKGFAQERFLRQIQSVNTLQFI